MIQKRFLFLYFIFFSYVVFAMEEQNEQKTIQSASYFAYFTVDMINVYCGASYSIEMLGQEESPASVFFAQNYQLLPKNVLFQCLTLFFNQDDEVVHYEIHDDFFNQYEQEKEKQFIARMRARLDPVAKPCVATIEIKKNEYGDGNWAFLLNARKRVIGDFSFEGQCSELLIEQLKKTYEQDVVFNEKIRIDTNAKKQSQKSGFIGWFRKNKK